MLKVAIIVYIIDANLIDKRENCQNLPFVIEIRPIVIPW